MRKHNQLRFRLLSPIFKTDRTVTTKQFQGIFYLFLGFCILIVVLSFTSFDFIEVDTAFDWTMRNFALPILITMLPISSLIYLIFIKQIESKHYRSRILTGMRTTFRIFILTLGLTFIFTLTTFSLIILTNSYLGDSRNITINAKIIDYRIEGEGFRRGITKHYIKIKDQQFDRIIELKVDRQYEIGEAFNKTMKIGKWGLLYSEN